MGKKDKVKKQRKVNKSSTKSLQKLDKKLKKIEQDTGEPTIEELLENYRQEQKCLNEVIVTICDPPSPRSHFTLTACDDTKELVLFGGEYFDGKRVHMFPELYIYHIKDSCWLRITSPNGPPPRSSHQAVYVKGVNIPSSVWIFGGEFASPSETRFHHYNDLWCFRTRSRKWELVRYNKTMYYNDLWQFDISTSYWTRLEIEGQIPSPRSACLFFPGVEQRYLYIIGGYSKNNVTRDMEKGIVHQDCYRLTLEKNSNVKSASMRQCGNRPNPPRSAMTGFTVGGDRAAIFGGVHDVESEDGEVINGYFHNDLFTVELSKARWHLFSYASGKKSISDTSSTVPTAGISNSGDEGSSSSLSNQILNFSIGKQQQQSIADTQNATNGPSFVEPPPRASAGIAVLGSSLYVYGGVYEVGDRKYTLNDFYFLDLNRPISWECLFKGTHDTQGWFESDSEQDDEDEDDEMVSDDDEAEEEAKISNKDLASGSKSNKTSQDTTMRMNEDDSESDSSEEDDELVEDAPIPNPNETCTGYWTRTSNFWCDLVTKGVQDESDDSDDDDDDGDDAGTTDQTLISKLAQKLAQDFYKDHIKK